MSRQENWNKSFPKKWSIDWISYLGNSLYQTVETEFIGGFFFFRIDYVSRITTFQQ